MIRVEMTESDAEGLRRILSNVLMLDCLKDTETKKLQELLSKDSDRAQDILEELAKQDEIFRYWP
jgi:hypothetical protein